MPFGSGLDTGEKIQLSISYLLRLVLLVVLVIAIFNLSWDTIFLSLAALVISFLPAFLSKNYKLRLPVEFDFILTVFIYAHFFLGEIRGFYVKFWWWDVMLHGGSSIAIGFIGFLILYTLYVAGRLAMSPVLIAIFSFVFALAIGSVWEIFEFAIDNIFGVNMQKSGLIDTMWDLIVNSAGALFVSALGYFYIKHKKHASGIFNHLVQKFLKHNPLFSK